MAWALSYGEDSESARREIEGVREDVIRGRQRQPIQPFFWGTLADALLRLDRPGEAMECVNTALAAADGAHAPFWNAELYRLTGEIRLAEEAPDEGEAEGFFRKAIEIAVDLEARSLELRAATSLARLRQHQGRKDDARALLAPVYDWFTEGFDTPDLRDAKALLEELA